jgi:hypothetical protein
MTGHTAVLQPLRAAHPIALLQPHCCAAAAPCSRTSSSAAHPITNSLATATLLCCNCSVQQRTTGSSAARPATARSLWQSPHHCEMAVCMQASVPPFDAKEDDASFTVFPDFMHHAFFTFAALTVACDLFTSAAAGCENPMADMMMAPQCPSERVASWLLRNSLALVLLHRIQYMFSLSLYYASCSASFQ